MAKSVTAVLNKVKMTTLSLSLLNPIRSLEGYFWHFLEKLNHFYSQFQRPACALPLTAHTFCFSAQIPIGEYSLA
jgi:hypothetical protein